jgi:hypothetical protein
MKFALDILGRLQKRSLTAVVEWAISITLQRDDLSVGPNLGMLIDEIWSTDEITRLVRMAERLPAALTYDELRIWETIKASDLFWTQSPNCPKVLDVAMLRLDWDNLMKHIEDHKNSSVVKPYTSSVF